ncbi:hypothetical protein [Psychroserpens ponticola]|uniref:M23 family metallopeptidase n=1 Tax=Psychroserpens ponticola TaxID=2932268 RepID=A0ABY7RUT7_9FLAO|nr:hypothetical protein [Psychroserpens ponticola]WCO00899.1 hypothetical protein MUN68_012580 [Psychroserpens ponticola]
MKYLKLLLYVSVGLAFNFNLFAQDKTIKVKTERNSDNSIDFLYEKSLPGSYYIILELDNLENANRPTFKKVLKQSSGRLFTLRPLNKDKGIRFTYKYKYTMGEPNPEVDSLFQYVLPFKTGSKVGAIVNKDFYGEKFLESDKNTSWYSLKFYSKTSDTVLCMRRGTIIKVRDEFDNNSTKGKRVTTKSNSITIEHLDGTIASYFGFLKDGIFVNLGQEVYPHTKLGAISNNYDNMYSFIFRQFYISDNETIYNEHRKLKDAEKGKKFIMPYFKTSNGSVQLENKKIYTSEFNEEIFYKEFSKREKKKYLKRLKN